MRTNRNGEGFREETMLTVLDRKRVLEYIWNIPVYGRNERNIGSLVHGSTIVRIHWGCVRYSNCKVFKSI